MLPFLIDLINGFFGSAKLFTDIKVLLEHFCYSRSWSDVTVVHIIAVLEPQKPKPSAVVIRELLRYFIVGFFRLVKLLQIVIGFRVFKKAFQLRLADGGFHRAKQRLCLLEGVFAPAVLALKKSVVRADYINAPAKLALQFLHKISHPRIYKYIILYPAEKSTNSAAKPRY